MAPAAAAGRTAQAGRRRGAGVGGRRRLPQAVGDRIRLASKAKALCVQMTRARNGVRSYAACCGRASSACAQPSVSRDFSLSVAYSLDRSLQVSAGGRGRRGGHSCRGRAQARAGGSYEAWAGRHGVATIRAHSFAALSLETGSARLGLAGARPQPALRLLPANAPGVLGIGLLLFRMVVAIHADPLGGGALLAADHLAT